MVSFIQPFSTKRTTGYPKREGGGGREVTKEAEGDKDFKKLVRTGSGAFAGNVEIDENALTYAISTSVFSLKSFVGRTWSFSILTLGRTKRPDEYITWTNCSRGRFPGITV